MEKYLPSGGSSDPSKLPGIGGIYNSLNLGLYTYSYQNPVKYVDPDGNVVVLVAAWMAVGAVGGGAMNAVAQIISTGTVRWGGIGGVADAAGDGAMLGPFFAVASKGAGASVAATGTRATATAEANAAANSSQSAKTILNLGSGNQPRAGMINLDYKPGKGVNVQANAEALPFANGSIDKIVAQSMESRLATNDVVANQMYRVLKNGGTTTLHSQTQFGNAAKTTFENAGFKNVVIDGNVLRAVKE